MCRGPAHLFTELVLLVELVELVGQHGVLLPQAGVPLVVLLHLRLDVLQCHLEVGRHLLPLLLLQTRPLHPLFLVIEWVSRQARRAPILTKT